jgi:hypothetical protein
MSWKQAKKMGFKILNIYWLMKGLLPMFWCGSVCFWASPDPEQTLFCTDPDPSINKQTTNNVRKTLIFAIL